MTAQTVGLKLLAICVWTCVKNEEVLIGKRRMKFLGLSLCLIFYQLRFSASASETADAPKGKTRTVSTLLNAKWNSTPTALEIAEFMNDEDPSYFWSFLEDISRNTDDFSKSMFSVVYLNSLLFSVVTCLMLKLHARN